MHTIKMTDTYHFMLYMDQFELSRANSLSKHRHS